MVLKCSTWVTVLLGTVILLAAGQVPNPPQKLTSRLMPPKTVILYWSSPIPGSEDITQFVIEYVSTRADLPGGGSMTTGPHAKVQIIFGLEEDTLYNISIQACSQSGCGDKVFTLIRTKEDKPAGSPEGFRAVNVTRSNIAVTWNEVPVKLQNAEITGYVLRFRRALERVPPEIISVDTDKHSWTFTGLNANSEYMVEIAALNIKGQGPFGKILTIRTAEDVPDAPSIEDVVFQLSSMSILVSPPATDKGRLTQWELSFIVDGLEKREKWSARTRLHHMVGIQMGKLYEMKVRGYTSSGAGEWSEIVEKISRPVIDNFRIRGCGSTVRICYDMYPSDSVAVNQLDVYYHECSERDSVSSITLPISDSGCVERIDLNSTCYSIKIRPIIWINTISLPQDETPYMKVLMDPECSHSPSTGSTEVTMSTESSFTTRQPELSTSTVTESVATTSESDLELNTSKICRVEKVNLEGFYSGEDGVPYYCYPRWKAKRCRLVEEMPGKSCVPVDSKTVKMYFKCLGLHQEDGWKQMIIKIAKDFSCKLMEENESTPPQRSRNN